MQNYKLEREVKKQNWLGEVHQGGKRSTSDSSAIEEEVEDIVLQNLFRYTAL
jgi:hypothetical protein